MGDLSVSKMSRTRVLAGALGSAGLLGLAKSPAALQTPAPSVTVDFRDIAERARLTAMNVSGDADRKRYVLETTGDGGGCSTMTTMA